MKRLQWLRVSVWLVIAVVWAWRGEPASAWLTAMLCAMIAFADLAGQVGERMASEAARRAAITAAMRVLVKRAEEHRARDEMTEALAVLDGAGAVGDFGEGP